MTAASELTLPGYQIEGVLGSGATSTVYRATREGRQFAVKLLKAINVAGLDLRFRQEVAAVARLDHPGLVKVFEAGELRGQPYMVMELAEGENLASLLLRGPIEGEALLGVCIALADAMAEVHRHGLVHRDVKPANIILGSDGRPRLIDFGFVTGGRDGKDAAPTDVAGTFLYAAPEQSGMLKRPIDNRSDLYALGVTLFECATGRRPFEAPTVSELLRQHAAVPAPPVLSLKPDVRPGLAAVIAKLLRKDPDDRYQTARGLRTDLEGLTTLEEEASRRPDKSFVLGARDARLHASFHDVPLVGRDAELQLLNQRWAQTQAGQGCALLVEGESGSGKTRLLRELIKQAQQTDALTLTGKAQKGEAIPLGPLREAIDELFTRANRLGSEERDAAYEAIRRAAGGFGALVRRLSRPLERLFANEPEMSALTDVAEEQDRFYSRVAEFLIALPAELGQPTILQIDDIQWLDMSSFEVLKRLVAKLPDTKLLLAMTSRDDPESAPARDRFLSELPTPLAARLSLEPLSVEAVALLIRAHLGRGNLGDEVVRRLAAAANGNALTVVEYVRAMVEAGMVRPTTEGWAVDLQGVSALTLSADLFALVMNRVARLSAPTRAVVDAAAITGLRFETTRLAVVSGCSESDVLMALDEASRAFLIEALDGTTYTFTHDRMVEALNKSLPAERATELHQRVAEALDANVEQDQPALVHSLALHYLAGRIEKAPARVFATARAAGLEALSQHANVEAVDLLRRSMEVAQQFSLGEQSLRALYEPLAEALIRIGQMDSGRDLLERALANARSSEDLARIRYLIAMALFNEGKPVECWKYLEEALETLGSPIPKSTPLKRVYLLWYWLLALVLGRLGFRFGSARGGDRSRIELIFKLYDLAAPIAYVLGNNAVYKQLTVEKMYLAHFLGPSQDLATAHGWYAYMMGGMGLREPCEKHGALGVAVGEQIGNRFAEWHARQHYLFGMEQLGEEAITMTARQHRELYPKIVKWCPPWEIAATLASFTALHLWRGHYREAVDFVIPHWEGAEKSKNRVMLSIVLGGIYTQLMILGRKREAFSYREKMVRMVGELGYVPWVQAFVYYFDVHVLMEQDDYGPNLEEAMQGFLQTIYEAKFEEGWTRYGYLVVAHARLELLSRATDAKSRRVAKRALRKALFMAESRAFTPLNRSYLLAVKAGAARLAGKLARAFALLHEAEDLAQRADSPAIHFLIATERARLAGLKNNPGVRRREAMLALELAVQGGWPNRVRRIKDEFELTDLGTPRGVGGASQHSGSVSFGMSMSMSSSVSGSVSLAPGRALTQNAFSEALLKVSLASTSTLDPVEQGRAALDELVRILGAERAYLFLVNEKGELELSAGRDTAGQDLTAPRGYSSTVVRLVFESRTPRVVTGNEEGEALGSESAAVFDLRSIMAAPLLLRDKLVGVVYVDSRLAKGLFTEDDVSILLGIASHIAIAVETSKASRVERERAELEKDLAVTTAVQSLFLPRESVFQDAHFSLAGHYRPASQCGGDWWWFDTLDNGTLRLLLADVTGHGVGPAMVTASMASAMKLIARQNVIREMPSMLTELNGTLLQILDGRFHVTISALELEPTTHRLRTWSAGAPPLITLPGGQGKPQMVMLKGMPLGSAEFELGYAERQLAPKDRVLVFTDGATELPSLDGRPVGLKRLSSFFAGTRAMSVSEARDDLVKQLSAVTAVIEDDLTFAVIELR